MTELEPRREVLVGEVVTGKEVAPPSRAEHLPELDNRLTFRVHSVDLPNRGRIEGMDRADAIRLAKTLGTRAYEAEAELMPDGVVVVQPITRIYG